MELKSALSPFVEETRKSLFEKNYYLALMAACTLPDICCSLEKYNSNRDDYIAWFEKFVKIFKEEVPTNESFENLKTVDGYLENLKLPKEQMKNKEIKFFSGVNAYVLRCAFLHRGDGELSEQGIYKNINKNKNYRNELLNNNSIGLIVGDGNDLYFNDKGNVQIDIIYYINGILDGVDKWIEENEGNSEIIDRASKLIKIEYRN